MITNTGISLGDMKDIQPIKSLFH